MVLAADDLELSGTMCLALETFEDVVDRNTCEILRLGQGHRCVWESSPRRQENPGSMSFPVQRSDACIFRSETLYAKYRHREERMVRGGVDDGISGSFHGYVVRSQYQSDQIFPTSVAMDFLLPLEHRGDTLFLVTRTVLRIGSSSPYSGYFGARSVSPEADDDLAAKAIKW